MQQEFYAVFTPDGLDQVCDTAHQARREARDLRAMGHTVHLGKGLSPDIYRVDELMRDGLSYQTAAHKVFWKN